MKLFSRIDIEYVRMAIGVLLGKMLGKRFVAVGKQFPRRIGRYHFVSTFAPSSSRNTEYSFAIYKDKNGKKAIAKRFAGRFQTFAYLSLKNEIHTYLFLKQNNSSGPSAKSSVFLPSYIEHLEKPHELLLLMSYESGQMLWNFSSLRNIRAYEKAITYLRGISVFEKSNAIPTRAGIHYICTYPFLLLVACATHPAHARSLFSLVPIFFAGIRELSQKRAYGLVHRDLHSKNILRKKNGSLAIMDLQLAVKTFPEYELICSLGYGWNDEKFRTRILEMLQNNRGKNIEHDTFILALMAFFVTHMLTSRNFSQQRFVNFCSYLSYVKETGSGVFDPMVFSLLRKALYIFPTYIHSSLLYAAGRRREVMLPKTIGAYRLHKPVRTAKRYPFAVGKYKDAQGTVVVAKVWKGKRLNVHAFNLLSEIRACRILSTIRGRHSSDLPVSFRRIKTPQFVQSYIGKSLIVLFMEPVTGRSIVSLTAKKQLALYEKAHEYFSILGGMSTQSEQQELGTKSIQYMLLVYPVIWLVSLFRHMSAGVALLQGAWIFFSGIFSLSSEPVVLSHGDLHTGNIFLDRNDKMTIIDLEQVHFTYKDIEHIASLSSPRNTQIFRDGILSRLLDRAASSQVVAARLSALCAFVSTHNLTSNLSPFHTVYYQHILSLSRVFIKTGKSFTPAFSFREFLPKFRQI